MFVSASLTDILWHATRFILVALPTLLIVTTVLGWIERGQSDPWE